MDWGRGKLLPRVHQLLGVGGKTHTQMRDVIAITHMPNKSKLKRLLDVDHATVVVEGRNRSGEIKGLAKEILLT